MTRRHNGSVFGDLGLAGLIFSVGLFYKHRPSFEDVSFMATYYFAYSKLVSG